MASEYTSITYLQKLENNIFHVIVKTKGQHKRADSTNIYDEVRKTLDYEKISPEFIN